MTVASDISGQAESRGAEKQAVSRPASLFGTLCLPQAMIRTCRKALFLWKVADSRGTELTGGKLLASAFALRRVLLRQVLESDEEFVGILLPSSVGAVVTNAAVTLARRVAANLNFKASSEVLDVCIRRAGIRHVLTTREVVEQLKIKIDVPLVYLEDVRREVRFSDRLVGFILAYLTPAAILDRLLGLDRIRDDDVLTVIFTSGSTGVPKGVLLTYRNIASNVDAINQVIRLSSSDTILGILPFFHSFGYTVTLWAPLTLPTRVAYHFNPLEARQVGKLAGQRKATILLATPTFLRSYLKRCEPKDFATMEVVVAGAEKLPSSLASAFEEKFGVRPVEGYGCTELSPLVSVNVPPTRSNKMDVDAKEGTVGRPVPTVRVKIVDPETYEELPRGTTGMLLVTGPNVMKGYLGEDDKTAEVVRDGWYVTGDIAQLDDDGFIEITGRLSRFSKMGGEMVPHVRVEEALASILGDGSEEEIRAVVTAVPDERKGERLVVIHKRLGKSPHEICLALSAAGLPNLWIPGEDSFLEVEEIPLLGSGKTDLNAASELAKRHFGREAAKRD